MSSIPEIVSDGSTGVLVPPDDVPRLAEAIESLLDDRELARGYGEAGLSRARTEFSVAAMAERTIAVYESAVDSPLPAAEQSRTAASAHDATE